MSAPEPPVVVVHERAARRSRRSHPWIFRSDLADPGAAIPGEVVRVRTGRGIDLGFAHGSARSAIALRRLLSRDGPDAAGHAARALRAYDLRARTASDRDARRLVFGESDDLPGLVVDRYGEHLVVQCQTAAAERFLPAVLEALASRGEGRGSVLARNDAAVRALEGLPREVRQLRGTTPPLVEVREGPLVLTVDPWQGHKTGLYLDQADNRLELAPVAGGDVLDVFCYQGAFALQALAAGAASATGIDGSEPALARAQGDAERNGLSGARFLEANAFDELRRLDREGAAFDAIAVDPPAFAKSRRDRASAYRAYKEVNLRAMRLLRPGGKLISSSCSYHVGEDELLEVLAAAASDAGRPFRLVARRTQASDHPIRLGFPESRYLKCLVLELM